MTVNTAPQRAKILVGRVVEALKDDYIIDHVGNCECKRVCLVNFSKLTQCSHTGGRIQGSRVQA